MTESDLIELAHQGMMVMVKVAAGPLLGGMAIGLVVSMLQTLTSLQEPTLTFVPKVLGVMLILLVFLPFMLHTLFDFTHLVLDRAVAGG